MHNGLVGCCAMALHKRKERPSIFVIFVIWTTEMRKLGPKRIFSNSQSIPFFLRIPV